MTKERSFVGERAKHRQIIFVGVVINRLDVNAQTAGTPKT